MTLSNTIKKAEKLAAAKVMNVDGTGQFFVSYKGYHISFIANGRIEDNLDAICFYVSNKSRTEDDMNSDYWPGTFWDNLTQCFKSVDRKTAA